MASGPHWNNKRGTWNCQYWDGHWRRVVLVRKQPGWKPGGRRPAKPPEEATLKMGEYILKEKAARARYVIGAPRTLADFLNEHVETYHNDLSKQSARVVVKQFLAWCHRRKISQLDQVTSAVCGDWIDEQSKKFALETVRRKRAQLAVAWNRLKKRGKIPVNPWDGIAPGGKPSKVHRGSWSPEQFERLMAVSRPWLRHLLVLGINTGLRIAALMELRWDDIERAKPDEKGFGWVRVRPDLDKAKRGYRVPISPKLHDALAPRFGAHDTEFVLVGYHGKPVRRRDVTGQAIRRACHRANLPRPHSPNHHMRRTFGRWAIFGHLTGTPVPLYVVSRWLGHSTIAMTLRYLDISEEDSTRFMLGAKE